MSPGGTALFYFPSTSKRHALADALSLRDVFYITQKVKIIKKKKGNHVKRVINEMKECFTSLNLPVKNTEGGFSAYLLIHLMVL